MNSHELQNRIKNGDSDAFRELYAVCGQGVYQHAYEALKDTAAARDAVKQVFLVLHREILQSDHPLDIDARLTALTDSETETRLVLDGVFDAAESLQASAQPSYKASSDSAAAHVPAAEPAAPPQPPKPSDSEAVHDAFKNASPYLPPLERAEAHMQADGIPVQPEKKSDKPKEHGNVVITVLIVIFLLMFLWVLAGILMDFDVLPRLDLGFSWFNQHIFPLFNLD